MCCTRLHFSTRICKDDLITALSKTLREFYGQNIQQSPDYGRIVNLKHYHRLTSLLNSAHMNIVFGGHSDEDERYIEPTLLDHVTSDSAIMQEEIFGPILPILTYQSLDEAIAFIHQRPKPLSLYLFSEDENATQRVINELSFGGGAINDTLMHLANPKLPFGGVGASGMGRYHGKYSFDTFTHEKATFSNLHDWNQVSIYHHIKVNLNTSKLSLKLILRQNKPCFHNLMFLKTIYFKVYTNFWKHGFLYHD